MWTQVANSVKKVGSGGVPYRLLTNFLRRAGAKGQSPTVRTISYSSPDPATHLLYTICCRHNTDQLIINARYRRDDSASSLITLTQSTDITGRRHSFSLSLIYRKVIRVSVSGCETLLTCQSDKSQDHKIFIVRSAKNSASLPKSGKGEKGEILDGIQKQLEIWGKAQREFARRPKSDWGKCRGEGEISPVAKSHSPHSNAIAYAKRAPST